ncbi:MAG: hypothetical protein LBM07_06320 [Culturomica sp.]|jgi:hypothetical protein|nr:hypothetical protein [Culturomica sp.]
MKKTFLFLLTVWFSVGMSKAQPAGIYGYTIADNKVVVSDLIEFSGLTDEQIFVNALLFAIDRFTEEERFAKIDFEKHQFTVDRCIISENLEDTRYYYSIDFKLSEGMLTFWARNIFYKSSDLIALGSPKGVPFEKLNPEKRPKQQAYLDEFLAENTAYIREMTDAVRRNAGGEVTHWTEIATGKVVKGMNETEVKLIYGKPQHTSLSGERCRMLFKNNIVVILESGIVSNVIK